MEKAWLGARMSGCAPLALAALAAVGCTHDEPPPPLPSPQPTAVPTPAPVVIQVEDAGVTPAPSATAKKGSAPAQSFAKCCSALLQNATLAPEPNKTYFNAAANLCSSMVAAGKSGPSIVSAVQGVLRGAGMPAACAG